MGGGVTVSSEKGVGSVFSIYMPRICDESEELENQEITTLEGENMVFGVWDTGGHGRPTHVEFTNSDGTSRVSLGDAATPNIGFHAAHVAGTVGANGVNISAKGMAPKSSIVAYNASSDSSETITEHLSSGMLVTNHSYGVYLYVDGEQNVPDW